jgi:hypothetical protein
LGNDIQLQELGKKRMKHDRKEICVSTLKQLCNFVAPLINLAMRMQTNLPKLPSASA